MQTEPLIIDQEQKGILRLKGPLTTENLASFQNAVRRDDASIMFLDFTEVPYVDSAGLGTLISAYTSRQKAGKRVVLTGVNERVLKLFEVTRVESLFLMFRNVEEALDALLRSGTA